MHIFFNIVILTH